MRHHFTNDGCAHAWANQTSTHGRGSHGSVWFDGSRIYSYGTHFLTAALLPGPLVLFNSASYSSTTSGHQSSAKAASGHIPRFTIPDPANLFDIFESTGINDRLQAEADGKKRPPFRSWPREGETPLAATRRMIRAYVREHAQDLDGLRESLPYRAFDQRDNPQHNTAGPGEPRLFPVWLLGLVGLGESSWRKILDTDTRRRARLKASAEKMALSSDIRSAKRAADMPESSFLEVLAKNADLPIPCTSWQIEERVRIVKETATKWRRLHKTAKRNLSAKRTRIIWGRVGLMAAEARRLEVLENRVGLRPRIREAVTALRNRGQVPMGSQLADWGKALADMGGGQAAHALAHDNQALVFRLGRALEALASEWGAEGLGGGVKAQAAESLAALAPYQESIAQAESAVAVAAAIVRRRAEVERQKANREAWQAGESGVRFHGVDEMGAAYLRAVDMAQNDSGEITGGRLQTSQGAEVPLAEAFRAFRFLKLCREHGQGWEANGQDLRVGHFRIESVSAGGDFRALCHFIRWQEVARLAESLGVLGYAADDSAVKNKAAA